MGYLSTFRYLFVFLAILRLTVNSSRADLTHRWSFEHAAGAANAGTVIPDAVSGSPAVVRGIGATFDGAQITLPGTTNCVASDATISAYVDLPNGIISSKTNLTVEVWATPIAGRSWQHLFEFGRLNNAGDGAGAEGEWTGTADSTPAGSAESGDTLLLSLCRGNNLNQHNANQIATVARPKSRVTRISLPWRAKVITMCLRSKMASEPLARVEDESPGIATDCSSPRLMWIIFSAISKT